MSDVQAQGGRRNRNQKKPRQKSQAGPPQTQAQSNGGPLDALDEAGEPPDAVGGAKERVGGLLGGGKNGGGGKKRKEGVVADADKDEDGGGKETLRLKIELNLDVELELKATIKGDIVIGLLS